MRASHARHLKHGEQVVGLDGAPGSDALHGLEAGDAVAASPDRAKATGRAS